MKRPSSKQVIADAFARQVKMKRFGEVSISDITRDCECARATFYYHFRDKYDVALWVFKAKLTETWGRDRDADWISMMRECLQIIRDESELYLELLAYSGQNSLHSFARATFSEYAEECLGRKMKDLPADIRYAILIYTEGLIQAWREWLANDEKLSAQEFARILGQNAPQALYYATEGPLPVDPVDFLERCYQRARG